MAGEPGAQGMTGERRIKGAEGAKGDRGRDGKQVSCTSECVSVCLGAPN